MISLKAFLVPNRNNMYHPLEESMYTQSRSIYDRSKPAPDDMAWRSLALNTRSLVYNGSWSHVRQTRNRTARSRPTFNRLTHVLAVGNLFSSLPASRIAKFGVSCLKPLSTALVRFGIQASRQGLTKVEVGCNWSQTAETPVSVPGRSFPKPVKGILVRKRRKSSLNESCLPECLYRRLFVTVKATVLCVFSKIFQIDG